MHQLVTEVPKIKLMVSLQKYLTAFFFYRSQIFLGASEQERKRERREKR